MGLCSSSSAEVVPDLDGLSREKKLRMIFAHLDSDHNGVVTFNEMMATAGHLNSAEKTAVLHQFEQIDRNSDEAIDEQEYVGSMLKAYKVTSDKDFDKWVRDMMRTKAWDADKLRKLGIKVRSRSFQGKGAAKYVSPEEAAARKREMKAAKKKAKLQSKLQNVEQWGEKLGYTEDHAHYHAPTAPQTRHMEDKAATKIQGQLRMKLAKKQTFDKRKHKEERVKGEAATKIQSRVRGKVARQQSKERLAKKRR